jgi:hypothetical protein
MSITPGSSVPAHAPSVELCKGKESKKDQLLDDASFEKTGSLCSLTRKRMEPFVSPTYLPGLGGWSWSQQSCIDMQTVHSGKAAHCFYLETCVWNGTYFISQFLNAANLPAGNYQVGFWMKGKDLRNNTLHIRLDYQDKEGKSHSRSQTRTVSGSFEWTRVTVDFNLQENAYTPCLKIGVGDIGIGDMKATDRVSGGRLWIDDVFVDAPNRLQPSNSKSSPPHKQGTKI